MKHLKLFFALFAMLALGVSNAWGAESKQVTLDFTSNSWGFPSSSSNKTTAEKTYTSGDYSIKLAGGGSNNGHYFNSDGYLMLGKSGATLTLPAFDFNTTKIVVTGKSGASGSVKQNIYVGSNAVSTETTGATGTNTYTINEANQAAGNVYILKVTSAHNTQITKIEVYGESNSTEPPTPTTQYTIKWHTAKGVTTDVTLNEGATITKPATAPAMTGYEFMGWTDQCNVATDGAGFSALSDFGTADSDKDFYAVFAVAETTGGGGSTTGSKTLVSSSNSTNYEDGYITGVSGTNSASWTADGFTMVQNKNSSSSAVALNYAEIRVYASHSIVFTPSTGSTITSIVATATSSNYADALGASSIENCTKSVSSSTVTITPTDGTKAITITNSAQSRLKTIVVNYTTSGGGTTTYDNYITTCASDIEYVELGDDFKWSATEAEVTIDATDNVFPTLTNTHNVPVTYSSSDETIASIASDGTVTLEKEGTVTITAKYTGGTSAGTGKEYKTKTVTYSLKVNKAAPVASGTTYVKVTSTAGITDGEYLIVYETGKVAFDGSLTSLDATKNTIDVEINNNTIAGTNYIDLSTFTIDATAGTIKSKSGYYIGKTATGNGLNTNQSTKYTNTITIDANKNAVVTSSGGPILRYNKAADQLRFRYFGSGQEAIALYKKASSHTLTYGTCTNGSVSADVADGATVLSGTTITLSNTPATDYKLSAYDVYKTDDATVKVTVTDGKFVMPEYDVTISATFEAAKTLTSIEITTAANQTTFWQGETFNYTGLEVTAHFDGAADEVVTPTVTGSTATAGTQTVTVSYKEGEVTKDATYTITVKAIPNTKETAYTVADAFDIIDKLGDTDKMYITGFVSQADLVQSTIDQYKNADYWISADGSTNGQQLEAYRGKYLDNADFTSVNQIMVGDEVIIYGKLTKYGSTYEFASGNYLVSLKRDKQQPELSYTTTEYNVNLGDAFTAPTLNNPHTLAVTYSSSNEDVATVATDGAVTIKAAGTVTITASFAGDDTYVTGSASYTINITDPNVSEATFVAGTDKSDTKSISKNGITVEFADGSFSRDDNYRCYAGKSMTISYADGNITKIVIECTANDGAEYGPGQFTTETATYSYSGKVGTWTGEANSVTFTNIKQVRMTAITVCYKQDHRQEAGLAWNPATVSLTVGDAFTAPTFSNPNSVTGIEFTSSNDALATVSNAGVISLVSGKTGTATITATFAGDATYKPAEVTCTIIVNHKSEDVVILAKCKDQYYALVAEYVEEKNDVLQALPVEYVGSKIYNVETEDQASIIWKRVVVDGKTTFKNGDNYLSAVNSVALNLATEACEWVFEGDMYKIEGSTRTILYYTSTGGFKNYSINNMSNNGVNGEYSSVAITVAPVFADGDAYHRTVTTGNFGTICIPYGSSNYKGAEFYEVAWVKMNEESMPTTLYLDQLEAGATLEAGKPYIFKATATEIAIIGDGTSVDTPIAGKNGLTGTFENITADGILVNNYIIAHNQFWTATAENYLNAYRAYIVPSSIPTTEPAEIPGRRRIAMGAAGENEATGLDNITTTDTPVKVIVNGQLIIIREGVKYNVQGVRL